MSETETKILSLERRLNELLEQFQLHQHLGTDTRVVDYRHLDNKPIDIDGTLSNRLGAGGLKIGANGSLSVGQTAYNTGTGFWLERNGGTPRMSLGVAGGAGFTWDGTTFSISGTITATAGTIGGFTIGATTISATNLTLTSGAANTANIVVGTGSNAAGLNSANAAGDIAIWAGSTFANRATAPFRVEADGSVTATDITATGTINAQGGYIGAASTALAVESAGLNVGTTGSIRGGMTAYNTGTGWFIGYSTDTYKLSIGNSSDTSNLLLWDGTNLIVNDTAFLGQDIYGDGSDGNVTISGDTTLTTDMFYNNLTVATGVTLNPGGFRIFVKGTLTLNGTGKIARDGNAGVNGTNATGTTTGAGTGGAGGSALADGSIKGAIAGIAGVNGVVGVQQIASGTSNGNAGTNGGAGTNVAKSLVTSDGITGVVGGTGGNGTTGSGTGTGAAGGTGGAGGTRTGTVFNKINNVIAAYLLYDVFPSGDNLKAAPSNGACSSAGSAGVSRGSGGGTCNPQSGATGGAGGGGGQGGIVVIFARKIVLNTGTVISANGGTGGNAGTTYNSDVSFINDGGQAIDAGAGGSGGSAGGDGGNGGVVILVYNDLTNNGTIQAAGGAGGTGAAAGATATRNAGTATTGTTGANGTTGNAGVTLQLRR